MASSEQDEQLCYPLLHVNNTESNWRAVHNNIERNAYDVEDYSNLLDDTNGSLVYYSPSIKLDASDVRTENIHTKDSEALLLILLLLFLTVVTIWVFKVKRFRILHETGLAMIYGISVGVVLRYIIPPSSTREFYLVSQSCNESEIGEEFKIGDNVVLLTQGGDDFHCSISSKVFKSSSGDRVEQTLLFDPELFFFVLLPPIIFYAGYSLQKQHFFRNIGSLMLYAFAGTTISCFIVGALMYSWVLSGIDNKIAVAAGNSSIPGVPSGFKQSIIPSLLFGSLISATDPVTVLAIFHDLHVDFDLYSLVFGESVMNDAVAIVLFRSVDEYTEGSSFEIASLFKSIGTFVGIFLGSFLLGCFMGLATALLMKFSKLRDYPLLETSMFIIMSYASFVLAELASLTGIVAILFCGITQSHYTYINLSLESRRRTKEIFEILNFLAENFVFSYMGLSLFTYRNHQWVPGFITVSFVAIFAGRVINIYILSFFLNLGRTKKIGFRFQHMLVFAGLRGAIAFALAIRNTQSEERQLIFTTTLVIVIITVFVCGGFTTLVLQCLKIRVGVVEDTEEINEDGEEIEYDRTKGNYLVSKWSVLNKKFLVPLFTHRGRPLQEFCPRWCSWCINFCSKCKPDHELLEEESTDESGGDISSEEDENVVSFRHSEFTQSQYQDENEYEEEEGGDIGLGLERKNTRLDDESAL